MAEARISRMYSCHQWHHVEAAVFFLGVILELKSVCKMNSNQAPRTARPMVSLVGTHNAKHRFRGRELLVLSDRSPAVRDKVNTLGWRVTLGKNESGMLNSTGTLQDPEVEYIIMQISQE